MLEFNKTIEEVIAAQESAVREKAFINLGTKKQIMDSPAFSDAVKDYIFKLKNTYSFELHSSGKYMVITMYYGKTKKYDFIILDMENFRCATADSIKNAKLAVIELVNGANSEEVAEVEEETVNAPEELTETVEEVEITTEKVGETTEEPTFEEEPKAHTSKKTKK